MARVHHRKARKDYPDNGIKKGDMYYFCQIKTGPRSSRIIRQIQPLTRSQKTSSEYLIQLYDWEDSKNACSNMEDAEQMASEIRELGEETEEKFYNMPEGLQQGDTGCLLEERAESCSQAADEIDEIISDWETAKDELETEKGEYQAAKTAMEEADNPDDVEQATEDFSLLDEPDEELDEGEFLDRLEEVAVE